MKVQGRRRLTHALSFLALLAPAVRHLEAQTVKTLATIPAPLVVKDSYTGKAVPGAMVRGQMVANAAPDNLQLLGKFDTDGKLVLAVIPDKTYAVEISAPGYKTVRSTIGEASGQPPTTEMFDFQRITKPAAMVQAEAEIKPGYDIVLGYVLDEVHSVGIANATVRLKQNGSTSITDADGFFRMKAPVPPLPVNKVTSDDETHLDTIIVSAPGYKTLEQENFELWEDSNGGSNFALVKGVGTTRETLSLRAGNVGTGIGMDDDGSDRSDPNSPALDNWLNRREQKTSIPETKALGIQGASEEASPSSSTSTTVPLPDEIFVGPGCKRTAQAAGGKTQHTWSCATIVHYPLEVYVAMGLGDEWPFSDSADSLAAGAVAYRSYAVWYQSSPLSIEPRIDICDTTSCQVFRVKDKTPAKTQAAAAATAGVVLSADGAHAIKAEYAAETNGLAVPQGGCLDGQTGQINNLATGQPLPANQAWPCVPDALSQGATAQPVTHKKTGVTRPKSDHGRGMSQRGSERWATGKNSQGTKVAQTTPWQCILDHYYNDNANGTGSRIGARNAYLSGSWEMC